MRRAAPAASERPYCDGGRRLLMLFKLITRVDVL